MLNVTFKNIFLLQRFLLIHPIAIYTYIYINYVA